MPKFRQLESKYYQHSVPSLSVDYYDPDSHGKDDFSRKQVWFYVYGDEDLTEEFKEKVSEMFEEHIANSDIEWDLLTLYPTHVEGGINPHLRDLFLDVAGNYGIQMDQVLERTETIEENHEIKGEKSKVVNLEGSVDTTKDLDGKNVIIVDNIVLSGTSMLHGANKLKENGADKVLAVSLGTDQNRSEETEDIGEGFKISELFSEDEAP